jgi:hypothetical protein
VIPDEAVEAAAKVLFEASPISQGARPWSEQFTEKIKIQFREDARTAIEAAAPHLVAPAWEEGHESGFWNGRESSGSGEMAACGVEHAKLNNPYRTQEAPRD